MFPKPPYLGFDAFGLAAAFRGLDGLGWSGNSGAGQPPSGLGRLIATDIACSQSPLILTTSGSERPFLVRDAFIG
jgi:hypothetical protein